MPPAADDRRSPRLVDRLAGSILSIQDGHGLTDPFLRGVRGPSPEVLSCYGFTDRIGSMNFSIAGENMRDLFQMHTINLSVGSLGRFYRLVRCGYG